VVGEGKSKGIWWNDTDSGKVKHSEENGYFFLLTESIPLCSNKNVSYSVNTQLYISTVILYIHSGHIMATYFGCKWSSSGQFLRYNKVSTQCDSILFTVRVKIMYDEILIYN